MQTAGKTGSPPVVLNPQFVETLMGFTLGWTDCGASATPSSQAQAEYAFKLLAGRIVSIPVNYAPECIAEEAGL
jgi:hypothetical protein